MTVILLISLCFPGFLCSLRGPCDLNLANKVQRDVYGTLGYSSHLIESWPPFLAHPALNVVVLGCDDWCYSSYLATVRQKPTDIKKKQAEEIKKRPGSLTLLKHCTKPKFASKSLISKKMAWGISCENIDSDSVGLRCA